MFNYGKFKLVISLKEYRFESIKIIHVHCGVNVF